MVFYNLFSLYELVKDGVNGYTFEDAEGLCRILMDSLNKFPNGNLGKFKTGIEEFQRNTWDINWDNVLLPNL
jgi:hypothetical protein